MLKSQLLNKQSTNGAEMERVNFKAVGILIAGLLVVFMFVNAIPWATKIQVKELRENLNAWYPVLQERITRLEEQYKNIDKKLDRQNEKLDKLIDRQ